MDPAHQGLLSQKDNSLCLMPVPLEVQFPW
jgi:hypothetical protein